MQRTQIHLTDHQVAMVKRISVATGMTKSDLIRTALDQWLCGIGIVQLYEFPAGKIKVVGGMLMLSPEDTTEQVGK